MKEDDWPWPWALDLGHQGESKIWTNIHSIIKFKESQVHCISGHLKIPALRDS